MNSVDWDNRWLSKAEHPLCPDPWLRKVLPLLPLGKTLDVACGRGRNALFLAEQGYPVHAIDRSEEGLRLVREQARSRRLSITTERLDLEQPTPLPLQESAYDLVIVFFYLYRPVLPALMRSLRPGGTMVLRTFSRAGHFPGGPSHGEFALEPGELLKIFAGWEVLVHEEGLEPSSKGGSLAGIVARRPKRPSCV